MITSCQASTSVCHCTELYTDTLRYAITDKRLTENSSLTHTHARTHTHTYARTDTFRHCATSRKVAVSIPGGVIKIFHSHNPSGRTMVLRSTQPLTEMSTRNIFWGLKAAGA